MGAKQLAVASAALQYSKWLSRFICWVWAIYRFAVLIASAMVPEAAAALVSTIGTLDTIMLVNEGTYLVNSLGEKYLYSDKFILRAFNKGWFTAIAKKFVAAAANTEKDTDEEDNTTDEEPNG